MNDSGVCDRSKRNLDHTEAGPERFVRRSGSTTKLAARIGVVQQNISDLERSERHDTIKLETLRRTADALDCDLVYAFVPRTSLDEAVTAQARRKAAALLEPVAHHSRLEDQSISDDDTNAQLDELAERFIDHRGLWTEPGPLR